MWSWAGPNSYVKFSAFSLNKNKCIYKSKIKAVRREGLFIYIYVTEFYYLNNVYLIRNIYFSYPLQLYQIYCCTLSTSTQSPEKSTHKYLPVQNHTALVASTLPRLLKITYTSPAYMVSFITSWQKYCQKCKSHCCNVLHLVLEHCSCTWRLWGVSVFQLSKPQLYIF